MSQTRSKCNWLNTRCCSFSSVQLQKNKFCFIQLIHTFLFAFSPFQEFQKALGSKQPVYDTTVRSGKAMRDKAQLPADTQKLDHLVGEIRDKWDTVCGKSVER